MVSAAVRLRRQARFTHEPTQGSTLVPRSNRPGMSSRTPAKHEIMCAELGREIGVLIYTAPRYNIVCSVWYDLTAGRGLAVNKDGEEIPDATPRQWEKSCSPGILVHYAMDSRLPVLIRLYEKAPNTFDTLSKELCRRLPDYGFEPCTPNECEYTWEAKNRWGQPMYIELNSGSGHDAIIDDFVSESVAVFVLHDPNAISEWAMRDTFAQEISARTHWFRALHTMGCNVKGLKRLPPDLRAKWFDFVGSQIDALRRSQHDMVIGAIERDDSQWAYMIQTSKKWRDETADKMRSAFQRIGRELAIAWLGIEPEKFSAITNKLFRTQEELRQEDFA